jgi:hypothetical protein
VADASGFLLLAVGAVTGVVTGLFVTWLLAGFVAGMFVALVGRLLSDARDGRVRAGRSVDPGRRRRSGR